MANADWYPASLAARIPWHVNFNAQAVANGTTHGLIAAQVTQITADSTFVTNVVNNLQAAEDYRQAVTAYKDVVLDGPIGAVVPAVPTPPATLVLPLGALGSIQARTRQFAAIIKASVGYTDAIGELYGIVAPAPGALADPLIQLATPLVGTPNVVLNLFKGGYDIIAIDMKRGGGGWTQIGVSQTASFTDTTALLVAGQPEQRDYRCQGMLNNARTGGVSGTVSAVTVP